LGNGSKPVLSGGVVRMRKMGESTDKRASLS
jgi:hypothetical protein